MSAIELPLAVREMEPKRALLALLREKQRRCATRKLYSMFPESGPLRREVYPRHLEFMAAGACHRERLMMAANRIGKTELGAYEMTLHLTGHYPAWWQGRRFDAPISAWAASETGQVTRDVAQEKLLGKPGAHGTGMIPADLLGQTRPRQGVPDGVETVQVRHASGDWSRLTFKSYDQGREAFQGTSQRVVWLDEEPSQDVYGEALLRTMDCNGIVMLTFTPLLGMSDVVLNFIESPEKSSKHVTAATWDDAPHLDDSAKRELEASLPPHQRDARMRGIPQLGSGAIYPVPESDIVVDPFDLPLHWPRAYGLDVGWNRTAALWGAWDRSADVAYIYSEHYRGQAEPEVHAGAIKARGAWVPGVIDPAANGRAQTDGKQLLAIYKGLGLDLAEADNSVESGIYQTWSRLSAGRLKVFRSCTSLLKEMRLYRRDANGKIVKKDDHAVDAMRYLIMSGLKRAKVFAPKREFELPRYVVGDQVVGF